MERHPRKVTNLIEIELHLPWDLKKIHPRYGIRWIALHYKMIMKWESENAKSFQNSKDFGFIRFFDSNMLGEHVQRFAFVISQCTPNTGQGMWSDMTKVP